MMPTPTEQVYTELQHAYNVFNAQLFDGQLPPCLITMQRKNRTYGYVSGERWNNLAGTVTDEIAMHPMHCATRSAEELLSTLAHEMVHLWQHHCGKPSRRAYHNREWAEKMEAIGLEPSDTGCPGGKRTGQHMSQYIRDGGPFHRTYTALLVQGCALSWRDRAREGDAGKKTKSGIRTKVMV
jgi:predicted SprT family Zn-dependent metalloprotease